MLGKQEIHLEHISERYKFPANTSLKFQLVISLKLQIGLNWHEPAKNEPEDLSEIWDQIPEHICIHVSTT